MTYRYIPGRGYTVYDVHGRVLAHSLSSTQRDALLAEQARSVISAQLLDALRSN